MEMWKVTGGRYALPGECGAGLKTAVWIEAETSAEIGRAETLGGEIRVVVSRFEALASQLHNVAFGVDMLGADGGTLSAEGAVPDSVLLDGVQ